MPRWLPPYGGPLAGQAPADPGVHEVAVTLAMFGGAEPAAGQPAEAPVAGAAANGAARRA